MDSELCLLSLVHTFLQKFLWKSKEFKSLRDKNLKKLNKNKRIDSMNRKLVILNQKVICL